VYRGAFHVLEGFMRSGRRGRSGSLDGRGTAGGLAAPAGAAAVRRAKDDFLATVAHELRTPVNAILGWSDMLRGGAIPEAKRRHAIDTVWRNAQRAAHLIDELLDLSRAASGTLTLNRERVRVSTVVAGAVDILEPAARARRIRIRVDVTPSIGWVYADAARLEQILWNLLSNAIKFSPENGWVAVRVRRAGDAIAFAVADSGKGIPPAFLPSLFTRYRQADGARPLRDRGLGLGLAIVKQLVTAHGGAVEAESGGRGRGATFTVRLPIVAAYHDGTSAERARSLAGIRVLVVDDDETARDLLATVIERHGGRSVAASSTLEALRIIRSRRVDVLVADLLMPGPDGTELVRALRTREAPLARRLPAVALTACADSEAEARARRAGFQMYLSKPTPWRALVDAVSTLARARASASIQRC
jgi:CheY-like chemotaxis protein/two-component sensor histidine kinase